MAGQEIHIEIKKPQEAMILLQKIHYYYPIGLPFATEWHEGNKELRTITTLKINNLIAHTTPKNCAGLINGIESDFKEFEVHNQLHRQFPNYAFAIKIIDEIYNLVQTVCTLNIKISLLTNHFTVFFEETSIFRHQTSRHIPVTFKIISSSNSKADPNNVYFEKIIDLMKIYFPDYQYIYHKILFTHIIKGGIPYGVDKESNKDYPLYFYLFDNDLITDDYKVI